MKGRVRKSIADKPGWCCSSVSGKGPDEALGTCRRVEVVFLGRHAGRAREHTWDEPPFAAATPVWTPLWRPSPSSGAASTRRTPQSLAQLPLAGAHHNQCLRSGTTKVFSLLCRHGALCGEDLVCMGVQGQGSLAGGLRPPQD
jgi:hypothetical protein